MLKIRQFEWRDVEEINRRDNDPEVTKFTGTIPPVPLEKTYENYRKMIDNADILLVAEENDKVIGSLEVITEKGGGSHVGTIGFSLKKEFWGKGIGTKLAEEGIRKAKERGLKKLVTYIYEPNERSIALMNSLGFELVGRLEKQVKIDETYYDQLIFEKLL